MTREIGSTFTDGNKTIKVVKAKSKYSCKGCHYYNNGCFADYDETGYCSDCVRPDNEGVIFKLIK